MAGTAVASTFQRVFKQNPFEMCFRQIINYLIRDFIFMVERKNARFQNFCLALGRHATCFHSKE